MCACTHLLNKRLQNYKKIPELPVPFPIFYVFLHIIMSNPYFRFQKFTIHHDRCAMKVGTDGVLLGAWAVAQEGRSILDIGTGSGLIALMMAQRFPEAQVMAVEVDEEAVLQATENVNQSPFADRVSVFHQDVRKFSVSALFDCVVCNPPFYTENVLPPTHERRIARNTSSLSFEDLVKSVSKLLTPEGLFNVILPSKSVSEFQALCLINGLYLIRKCDVRTKVSKPVKRTMLTFAFSKRYDVVSEELVLMSEDGSFSDDYQDLTCDFYLPK